MRFWLMKSEPSEVSIDDLASAPPHTIAWTGVRNYQARNFMRDQMQVGDQAFFYHSSCAEPGIAGIVEISSVAYPDSTQFDAASPYFDPAASAEKPRWISVDVTLLRKTPLVPLKTLRSCPELEQMRVLAKGSRLSITPVEASEWNFITQKLMR